MAEQPGALVIEARSHFVSDVDQPICIFPVKIVSDHGVWHETWSKSELSAFLTGLGIGITMTNGSHASFYWDAPEYKGRLLRKRWTLQEDGIFKEEDLDEEGNAIKI